MRPSRGPSRSPSRPRRPVWDNQRGQLPGTGIRSDGENLYGWFFLLAAAWVDPGRSALQSAEQWCKGRYGRIHQVGKMSFYDKNMQKGRLKQHTNKQKESETGNHPRKVPRLQKRAPVMSERQPLCRRRSNNIGKRWLW